MSQLDIPRPLYFDVPTADGYTRTQCLTFAQFIVSKVLDSPSAFGGSLEDLEMRDEIFTALSKLPVDLRTDTSIELSDKAIEKLDAALNSPLVPWDPREMGLMLPFMRAVREAVLHKETLLSHSSDL